MNAILNDIKRFFGLNPKEKSIEESPEDPENESKALIEETDGVSSITFEIDSDMNVVVKSKINKRMVLTLIDESYIKADQSEDEGAIQLSFVLIANEVTNQLIDEINHNAKEFNS